jgi:uncharacterized repeat protein (TIGR03803 family)
LGLGFVLLVAWACVASPARGGGTLTALASFNGTNGANPYVHADVTLDAHGSLYGVATFGGANGDGTVWELVKGSSTITPLASFDGTDGVNPYSGATLDANGNLYGTAHFGGANNYGTVWELAKGSSTITPLASFNFTNGNAPFGGVIFDTNGNLYGTTAGGGVNGLGVVWELAKGSSTITPLASFNGANGVSPGAGVTFDSHGNLYGTAQDGGANGQGTVWELAKGSSTITALASFNGANGALPRGGVTFDAHGNLYGTAPDRGANNDGTVWELARGSSTITALASFNGTNGSFPSAGVTFDAHGNLDGTAAGGGGTVWEIQAGSSAIATLATFNGTNGFDPFSEVTFDASGNLYGTAFSGGANNLGTVWEFQPSAVPEPSSLVLGLIGLAVAGGAVLRKAHHRL